MRHPCAASAFLLAVLLLGSYVATAADQRDHAHAGVYIVIVQPPADGVDSHAYHIGILAAALGSEERANEALLYSYRTVASGFAAKLTPPELAAVQKHPAVIQAHPDDKNYVYIPGNLN
ncbi:hypothetical protein GUJ93_ZPchr0007g5194 [Zizania palustris]|uniref:Inhibitor I9 domain-containing protein n=1 Tax=Zizania palustris TaxID=103762 RepID=A0A8J5W5A1_ZIZPA|nr:hypothetical protein GUJ93_ZPchr0007g5194 [Zizania palustris]